jgi:hypothetical protein
MLFPIVPDNSIGIWMLFRAVQLLKAFYPMSLTLSGRMMLVRLVQPLNAVCPIVVVFFESVTFDNAVQPRNALSPILVVFELLKSMSVRTLKY